MKVNSDRRSRFLFVAAVGVAVCGCAEKPVVKGPIEPGSYVVQDAEDDLSHIALRAYGDMKLWYSLLNANPELAKRPGFDLIVGESINVPAKADLDTRLPKSVFPKQLPADYIVMPGDSLYFIAKGCYGDRKLWERIYEANRDTLSTRVKENPFELIAGQVLYIPSREEGAGSREQGGGKEEQ